MDRYTYLILNTHYVNHPVAFYVRFPDKLSVTERDIFKRILSDVKHEHYDNLNCATFDIVMEALNRFERDYHISGVIVDGSDGMIMF